MLRPSSILPLLLAGFVALTSIRDAAAFTPAEAQAPMTVTLVRSDAADCGTACAEWLALTGRIGPGTPALLSAALARLGKRRVPVLVDSPGGAVEAAMTMGRAIRARTLDVIVAGTALTECAPADRACAGRRRAGERPGFVAGGIAACASACVLLLAAGTDRAVGPNSYVGVHQMSSHRTVTRVINTFRIMRRRMGGRIVEVSRTLIATRPVSSHTVQSAVPEALYSEVDRYLLGMGVKEAVMPLMRSTPPSGIHWMTPAELAATQIATDTTDAGTLVARAAAPRPAFSGPAASAMALATAVLGTGARASGIVDWRVDRSPGGPMLVGTLDIPERHLHGTVSIGRDTAPGSTNGFSASVDLGPPAAIEAGMVWTVEAPRICDNTACTLSFAAGSTRDDGQGRRDFGVIPAWGDTFLSVLQDRDWIYLGLLAADGRQGWVSLSLKDDARALIGEWEHLCCGLALPPAAPPAAGASPPLPTPSVSTSDRKPAPSEGRATFSLRGPTDPSSVDGTTTVAWTPLAPLDIVGAPGTGALAGSVSVPAGGLHVTMQAGPAASGEAGGVEVALSLVVEPRRFGPAQSLSVPPVWGSDGHVVVLADRVDPLRYGPALAHISAAGPGWPFSPLGRRWRAAPDEGMRGRPGPLIRPVGHLLPRGEKGAHPRTSKDVPTLGAMAEGSGSSCPLPPKSPPEPC